MSLAKKKKTYSYVSDIIAIFIAVVVFVVPFAFIVFTSLKDRREANLLSMRPPVNPHWENYVEVFKTGNNAIVKGFINSSIITFFSVILLVLVSATAAYVIQRRGDKFSQNINRLLLVGLMVPAAVMPTIWILQMLGLFKTMVGMIVIETALNIPFTVMLYRGYMASIPRELEEAAIIDGCSRFSLFFKIIFPLLKPVTATAIILNAVTVFNDFTNPLYFLPGSRNITIQQTLYNFSGRFSSSNNLLFANVVLITLPMLIIFIIFNKKIVSGMVSGSVKG